MPPHTRARITGGPGGARPPYFFSRPPYFCEIYGLGGAGFRPPYFQVSRVLSNPLALYFHHKSSMIHSSKLVPLVTALVELKIELSVTISDGVPYLLKVA